MIGVRRLSMSIDELFTRARRRCQWSTMRIGKHVAKGMAVFYLWHKREVISWRMKIKSFWRMQPRSVHTNAQKYNIHGKPLNVYVPRGNT